MRLSIVLGGWQAEGVFHSENEKQPQCESFSNGPSGLFRCTRIARLAITTVRNDKPQIHKTCYLCRFKMTEALKQTGARVLSSANIQGVID